MNDNNIFKDHLPKGWRLARLEEFCDLINGDAFKESDWSSNGIPIIRIQNLNDETKSFNYWNGDISNRVVVKHGDVLLAWSGTPGTSFGAHIWKRGLGVLNQHIFRVDLDKSQIDSQWAVYAINNRLDIIISKAHGGVGLRHVTKKELKVIEIPLPSLEEQKRISETLSIYMTVIARARTAAEAQLNLLDDLVNSYLRDSLFDKSSKTIALNDCLIQISKGVGPSWNEYPIIGATRAGAAPAKEPAGKNPERYKLVEGGTIFYNPMRILLGSIAMVDVGELPGITSPDYVVFKTKSGLLHFRWFYFWLRSRYGEDFIKTLTRGAVRERMLFKRLSDAEIKIPPWDIQIKIADKLKATNIAKKKIAGQLDEINQLPSAILRQAFKGMI